MSFDEERDVAECSEAVYFNLGTVGMLDGRLDFYETFVYTWTI